MDHLDILDYEKDNYWLDYFDRDPVLDMTFRITYIS